MRTAIYARLSKDRSGLSVNCDIQTIECREYAVDQGWDVVAEFSENDISASRYSKKPRPLYEQMIGLVRAGQLDVILATEGERLMRRPDEMSDLITLAEKHPLKIALTNDDGYDLTDSNGIYRARTGVALSERESRKTSERMRRKKAAQAREGRPQGGHRPYGYQADLITLNEPEATVLRLMGERLMRGHGYNEIAAWLRQEGHLTTTGKTFLGVTVRNTLQRVRYAGKRTHHGVEYDACWLPVFDAETWGRLQLEIKRRSLKNVPKARKYLLTGLLECGKCGGRLYGSKTIDRKGAPERRIYQCIDCRGVRRSQPALDWYIKELVIYRLDSPEMASLLQPGDDGQLRELLVLRQTQASKLDSLVEDYASGLLNRTEFARAKATAEALLAETQAALNRTAGNTSLNVEAGCTLRTAWEESPTDWRRQLIELLVSKIVVHPSLKKPVVVIDDKKHRFDQDAVEVSWVHH